MDNDGVLSIEEQQQIVEQMMGEWRRQSYAAEVNVRVARRLGDERMERQAVEQMKRAEAALAVLEEELTGLGEAVGVDSE
jgi:hypothetical protein